MPAARHLWEGEMLTVAEIAARHKAYGEKLIANRLRKGLHSLAEFQAEDRAALARSAEARRKAAASMGQIVINPSARSGLDQKRLKRIEPRLKTGPAA